MAEFHNDTCSDTGSRPTVRSIPTAKSSAVFIVDTIHALPCHAMPWRTQKHLNIDRPLGRHSALAIVRTLQSHNVPPQNRICVRLSSMFYRRIVQALQFITESAMIVYIETCSCRSFRIPFSRSVTLLTIMDMCLTQTGATLQM